MLQYILLMLTFGLVIHAKHVDVYGNSAVQTVGASAAKRQAGIPPEAKANSNISHTQINTLQSPNIVEIKAEHLNVVSSTRNPVKVIEHSQTNLNDSVGQKLITAVNESSKLNASQHHLDETIKDHDPILPRGKDEREHNGALLRSFYVFLGLSVIVMIYLTFRAFRVRPGAPPPATVRKYGIVGRRSDMEMLPLPLNEEEDDDTLFDVGNQQLTR